MSQQVPFIGRQKEITIIDSLLTEENTLRILCISASGGTGKTRLLQEIRERYSHKNLPGLELTEILDFDNYTYHIMENIGRQIAFMLDKKVFEPYLQWLLEYRKLEKAGLGVDRLNKEMAEGDWTFTVCFNQISSAKRVVLFFDTADALKDQDFQDYLIRISPQLENVCILLAGRNAHDIGHTLQSSLDEEIIRFLSLSPLSGKDGEQYLRKKQELLHIELEPELAQKLLLLSGGKPILIDLAVEWRTRGITLDWLIKNDLEEFRALPENELRACRKEFERHLAIHIAQTRTQMDDLILLMSRVYPVDVQLISTLLELPQEEARKIFEEAKTNVFVKVLPDGNITLHDEMRRMITDYVWDEVDPESDRRRRDSEFTAHYLARIVDNLTRKIAKYEQEEGNLPTTQPSQLETALEAFSKREALEQEVWFLKAQHLKHLLFANLNEGIQLFIETFDEATRECHFSFRQTLLTHVEPYIKVCSSEHYYEVESRRIKQLFDTGDYQQTKELVIYLLEQKDLHPEKQVNLLIFLANSQIRLGNVKKGITAFENALRISQDHEILIWRVKALNGLGWAHRLTGNVELARKHYQEARNLCLQADGPEKDALKEDYGWISNNLAFVLSDNNNSRRTAINIARSNLEYWESLEHEVGLGVGYSVLGIAYFRSDRDELAQEAFQKALSLLEPLGMNDWLGQIYSWQGALYKRTGRLDDAERTLTRSLKIGSSNIEAMTLYRLGRVYMAQGRWELAEQYMQRSIERAQHIPDFRYWLAALARFIKIAARKGEAQRFESLYKMLHTCMKTIKKPARNSLGVAYIGLAKLAMLHDDIKKIPVVIKLLKRGITFINQSTYANADILSQLQFIEKDFDKLNAEIIQTVGRELQEFSSKKELDNIDYSVVTPIMHRWANWKEEEHSHEA